MKYCIQRPFIENVTEIINIWRFLEGILSRLAEKKGEAEPNGALYALRCDVFRRLRKKVGQELLPYTGEIEAHRLDCPTVATYHT